MEFSEGLYNESRKTLTENGAVAYNTSGDALLDFFGTAGSLREADVERKERLFEDAYREDPLLATKCLFYVRDIRGGLGERQTFRELLRYLAEKHPEAVRPNISLIGEFGRFDDLYALIGTPVTEEVGVYMREQFANDEANMVLKRPVSLLAKWLKSADASSRVTRQLGIMTAGLLGMSVYDYKRRVKALRKYIDIVERKMSTNKWTEIDYETVPSVAMSIYRDAFKKHDKDGFDEYISDVSSGTKKINASTLFPYDILEKYNFSSYYGMRKIDNVLEEQWKALPNYVDGNASAIVIADTSGSMDGRPLNSAVALAIYFAERNTGAYHNLWMSFSEDSRVQRLQGNSLWEKLRNIDRSHWDCNTNLERAFEHILDIAVKNDVAPEEMIKSLIVISDMEIDQCTGNAKKWVFYDDMRRRFAEAGYEIPNIVFWNVNSRHDVFHADKNRKGVQLCSGQSASTFQTLMKSVGLTPMEMMMNVLTSDRYANVTIE